MNDSSEFLWSLFVAAAIGFVVLVIAFAAALVLAQRRFLKLQKAYGQNLLQSQDEERAWVAREVHDDVSQRIAVLRHELDLLKREAGSEEGPMDPQRLDGILAELADLGVAVRRLAHRLHPATLDQGDLRLALEQLAEDARRGYGLTVQTEIGMVPDLRSTGLALVVYRIGQESLRNISQHAATDHARLGIRIEQGQLVMSIEDDGKGFDPTTRGAAAGLGLLSMKERAAQAGGTATITSQVGQGTRIRVVLPLRGRNGR
jgi:signal transduction histidine kinase